MFRTTKFLVIGLVLLLTLIILAGNCRIHNGKTSHKSKTTVDPNQEIVHTSFQVSTPPELSESQIASMKNMVASTLKVPLSNVKITHTDSMSDSTIQVNVQASVSKNSAQNDADTIKAITPAISAIHNGCSVNSPSVITKTIAVPSGFEYIENLIESSILDALSINKNCINISPVDKYGNSPSILQISIIVEEDVLEAMNKLFNTVIENIKKLLHINHNYPSPIVSNDCKSSSITPLEIKPVTCCLADPGDLSDKPPYHSCGKNPLKSTTTPVIIPQTALCGSGTTPSQWCNESMDQFIKISQKYTKDGWDSPESAPWLEWTPTRSPYLYNYSNPSSDLSALVIGGATNVDFPPQLINDVTRMLMPDNCSFYVYMAQVDLSMLPKWFATPCNIYHSLLLFVDASKQQKEAEEIDPANIIITLELWANGSLEMALAPPITTPSPHPGGEHSSPTIDVSQMTKNQIVSQVPQYWGCTAAQFHTDVYQRFWYLGEMPDSSNLKDLVEEAQRWVKKNPGYSVLTLTPEPCETKKDWNDMTETQQNSIVRSVQCDAFVQNMLWYMMNSTTFQTQIQSPRFIPSSPNLFDTLKWNDVELVGSWDILSSSNWQPDKNGWVMSDKTIVTRQDILNWKNTVNVKIPALITEAKKLLNEAKQDLMHPFQNKESFNLSRSSVPVCNGDDPCSRPNSELTYASLTKMLHQLDSHDNNSKNNSDKTTKGNGWGTAGIALNMIANAVLSHFLTSECIRELYIGVWDEHQWKIARFKPRRGFFDTNALSGYGVCPGLSFRSTKQ